MEMSMSFRQFTSIFNSEFAEKHLPQRLD